MIVVAGAAALSLSACNDAAAERAASNREINAVIALIEDASRGYLPHGVTVPENESDPASWYRKDKLAEAAVKLEPLVDQGDPGQQLTARRLLSHLRISAATDAGRDVIAEWADLYDKGATLLNKLAVIEHETGQIARITSNDPALIKRLEAAIDASGTRLGVLQADAESLREKLEILDDKIGGLKEQRQYKIENAQARQAASFELEGEAAFEKQIEAIRIRREADVLSTEIDRLRAEASVPLSELKVISKQVAVAEENISATQATVDAARARAQQADADRAEAARRRSASLDAFEGDYEKYVSAVKMDVLIPLEQVNERITLAGEYLASAPLGSSRTPATLELDRLQVKTISAFILARRAIVLGALGQTLDLVAERMAVLAPDRASLFATTSKEIAEAHSDVIGRSQVLIEEALAKGKEIQGKGGSLDDPESIASAASAQLGNLNAYARQIEGTVSQ